MKALANGLALALAVVAGGCASATGQAVKGRVMAGAFEGCTARSARITLLDEGMLTRTAVTPETAARYGRVVELPAGDPRLAQLDALLAGLALEGGQIAEPELRTMVEVDCNGGGRRRLLASATQDDGSVHLTIDGRPAVTRSPLRKPLEQLAR